MLTSIEKTALIYIYFAHFVRSMIGFYISNKIPKQNDIIKDVKSKIDIDKLLEKPDIKIMKKQVADSVKDTIKGNSDILKKLARAIPAYGICSVICILLDCVALFMILKYLGEDSINEQKIVLLYLYALFWYCFYKLIAFG